MTVGIEADIETGMDSVHIAPDIGDADVVSEIASVAVAVAAAAVDTVEAVAGTAAVANTGAAVWIGIVASVMVDIAVVGTEIDTAAAAVAAVAILAAVAVAVAADIDADTAALVDTAPAATAKDDIESAATDTAEVGYIVTAAAGTDSGSEYVAAAVAAVATTAAVSD